MDACCATMKSTTYLANVSRGGFCNGENGFWGEKIRGSLNNCALANQFGKSLSLEKRGRKIKPGIAYSVLIRENNKETLVSISIQLLCLFSFFLSFLVNFSHYLLLLSAGIQCSYAKILNHFRT